MSLGWLLPAVCMVYEVSAEDRRRRERVRLQAVHMFEQRALAAEIAAELRRWTCQMGARRAIERDDAAAEAWTKETWPQVKRRRRHERNVSEWHNTL
jgi:hypothetical protein